MNGISYATTTAIATSVALSLVSAPAMAFTITQNNSTQDLLDALLGDTTGLSNFSISTTGDPNAFGLFNDDPFGLSSGIVLSTGNAIELGGQNSEDGGIIADFSTAPNDLSTDLGPQGKEGDATSLSISFDADTSVEKLFFEYVFGSEEFVEFGGSTFNDSFELLLNGENLATLTDGQSVTINHLVPDPEGSYHPDFISNPTGSTTMTKLDGYTKPLTFEGMVNQNATNTLTINIKDVGDGYLDSAVFLKGGSLGTQLPPNAERVPEPGVLFGLAMVTGMTLLKKFKPQL